MSQLNLSLTEDLKPELQSFDCEQRPVLNPEVQCLNSHVYLSLTKHPKRELQSFDCEQRSSSADTQVVRSSNVSTESIADQASETGTPVL